MGHRYFYFDSAIRGKDCDDLVEQYKDQDFEEAKINDSEDAPLKIRKSKVIWINARSLIARTVFSYVQEANQRNFGLNLSGDNELVQLTKYDIGDQYNWHVDNIQKSSKEPLRVLSASVQLSKPEDYTGGEIQLFNGTIDPEVLPIQNQGSIIVFRSLEWHRVTELTKGVRYSLVFWAGGS